MTLKEIAALSNARVIHENGHLDKVIRHAFAADLMSDVLRLDTSEMILITGLANLQVIRTAEMSDISFILFVRGKQASPDMVELAKECNIAILQSKQSKHYGIQLQHRRRKLFTCRYCLKRGKKDTKTT